MLQIHWDPTINLGTLLTIVTIITSLYGIAQYVGRIESKVNEMYEWFLKNTERILVEKSKI